MKYLVNLKPSANPIECKVQFTSSGYVVSECGSGRTCHVFVADGDALLPQGLQDQILSMVHADAPVTLDSFQDTSQDPGLWGLDYMDGTLDGMYDFDTDGAGQYAGVIDSAMQDLSPFGGRITLVHAPFAAGAVDHGQKVAQCLGGDIDGGAKAVHILHSAGFDGNGVGTIAQVTEAWVAFNDYVEDNLAGKRFTLNTSFSFPSDSFSANVARTQALGGIITASAGNTNPVGVEFSNLTRYPSQNDGVVVVAAHDIEGELAFFSNFGTGVTAAAPGVGLRVGDGTSFASPYLNSLIVRRLQAGDLDPVDWIKRHAVDLKITTKVRGEKSQTVTEVRKNATYFPGTFVVPPDPGASPPDPGASPPDPGASPPDPGASPPGPGPIKPLDLDPIWAMDGSDPALMFSDTAWSVPAAVNENAGSVLNPGVGVASNIFSASASLRPLWDGSALQLNDNGIMRSNDAAADLRPAPHTFMFACRNNDASSFGVRHLFDSYNDGGARQTFYKAGNDFNWYAPTPGAVRIAARDQLDHVWTVVVNGPNSLVRRDGVQVWAGNLGNDPFKPISVGSWMGGTARWAGPLYQLWWFDFFMTLDLMEILESWIAARIPAP